MSPKWWLFETYMFYNSRCGDLVGRRFLSLPSIRLFLVLGLHNVSSFSRPGATCGGHEVWRSSPGIRPWRRPSERMQEEWRNFEPLPTQQFSGSPAGFRGIWV